MNVFEIRTRSPSYCCPLETVLSRASHLGRAVSYHAHDNVYVRDRPWRPGTVTVPHAYVSFDYLPYHIGNWGINRILVQLTGEAKPSEW